MATGLEPAAAEELRRAGRPVAALRPGLVVFTGSAADGARAALSLRSASRVVLQLKSAIPAAAEPLREQAAALAWEDFLPARTSWAARAVGTAPGLRHTVFTARLVKDAVRDRFRALGRAAPPVDPERPSIVIEVRIERGAATIGLDLGAASLHRRRGPGLHGAAALHEDIAAGLALLAAVSADEPLLDPFCGSGTLIAEAAAVALGLPPRRDPARMALSRLPPFRDLALSRLVEAGRARALPKHPPFLAFDCDPEAVQRAAVVLERSGLSEQVTLRVGSTPDLPLPPLPPGLLLSDPPWGLRLAAEEAGAAWSNLGRLAHGRLARWRLALLSGNPAATRRLGLRAERRWRVLVGGVDARFLLYRVRG